MIPSTHLSLFAALKDSGQQQSAWERLYGRYHETIFRWCLRHGLQPADAEDMTQAVWTRLLRALPDHEHDAGRPFRCWLKAVVANAIRDRFRAEGRRPGNRGTGGDIQDQLAQLEAADSVADLAEEIEMHKGSSLDAAMERVRARVTNPVWQAFWMLTVDELLAAEVAAALGMTVGSVYQAKYRVSSLFIQEYRP